MIDRNGVPGNAPWQVERDQDRTARQRRLDEAKRDQSGFQQEMADSLESGRVRFSEVTNPIRNEEIGPETGFERAMREGIDAAIDPELGSTGAADSISPSFFDLSMEASRLQREALAKEANEGAGKPYPARVLSLEGPEMIAYVRVKAASLAAMAAQQAHQAAGSELRAAIEAMCQLLAPPVK